MNIMVIFLIATIVITFTLFTLLHEKQPKVKEEIKQESKHTLDPSEDYVYVEFEETENYVHMWQNEPGTGENIKYIGRFEKYNVYDMADLLVTFARGKEYMLSSTSMPQGLRDRCREGESVE